MGQERQSTRLIAKSFHESPRYGRVTRRTPMAVRKKVSRFGGQHVVEIDTDIRKLAKDRGGKTELW